MWLIIRTARDTTKRCGELYARQDIQQRDAANYTDDKTYNKKMWLIIRTTRQDIQQKELANYTDDNTYNKEMWLITPTTRHTTKRCG